ncbi:ATP-dependent zinc metalloprotease FtsH [Bacteroidales bacterium OttesenSCG-928-B11]|nr:ATP-dependent zinc metalloprotease FtsH [Bacteroidales bacterium OttesenSCG-928-E04]MDL2308803.1 ATP-dependent zinc metalloprotease FtsH [Bacteroidales bacterium OttesenSCG-928-C03]MDL2312081.1 ATP-dependent zinc metalloprotease FtsH [Bacteroidales bacterium OttesenSCG-928-B11]MDL2325691.1 ATP-dependent zinc metalloprotease FtsH [Bacteroidales bacterium OttesenSCG-928-A14]
MEKKTQPNKNQPNPANKKFKFNIWWAYIVIIAAIFIFYAYSGNVSIAETDNLKFKEMVEGKEIKQLDYVMKDHRINIYLSEEALHSNSNYEKVKDNAKGPQYFLKISDYKVFSDNLRTIKDEIIDARLAKDSTLSRAVVSKDYDFPIKEDTSQDWGLQLFWLLPFLLILGFFFYSTRAMRGGGGGGGGIFSIGKSKAQLFDEKSSHNVSFKDVAGLEGAKYEVEEIVDFLKNPTKYTELGGKIPKGALLVGPPGTGKTLLAKAVAGEAKVPFFSLSGSDFVEMFVGVGASRVRDLFKTAKEKAPCIIFIDEIDAIGRARGKNVMSGANDERENTLNQLLTEMDGFSSNTGVIILAATNRADILDRALLRAGRFDRQIHIELPNLNERKEIFEVHIRNLKLGNDVDLDFFAKQTPGFSGADIANVCNEAALVAARHAKKQIDKEDFLTAIDRIIGGLEKRGSIISPQEKRVIAYHEAGHATVSWLLEHASPLVKVTIVPRGRSLGAAWYLPEERNITTFEQLFDEMTATMGGRAAEEVVFGQISTGALSDLERITKQAHSMVVYYGLNKKIGNISYYDSTGQQEYSFHKPYSEKTAQKIDEEVHELIESAYTRAKSILNEHRDKLSELAELLLEKEVIFSDNLEQIFGKREFNQPQV